MHVLLCSFAVLFFASFSRASDYGDGYEETPLREERFKVPSVKLEPEREKISTEKKHHKLVEEEEEEEEKPYGDQLIEPDDSQELEERDYESTDEDQLQRDKKSSTSTTTTTTTAALAKPKTRIRIRKVAFLFLTKNRILTERLWASFFQTEDRNRALKGLGDSSRYNIYIHTHQNATSKGYNKYFRPYIIPSVNTAWGVLQHAMQQLLVYAYMADVENFKFVFVSDSTMPLKPFHVVYKSLVNNAKSSFCFFPPWQGSKLWLQLDPEENMVSAECRLKAELWSALTRSHVQALLEKWSAASYFLNQILLLDKARIVPYAADEVITPSLACTYGSHEFNSIHGAYEPNGTVRCGHCTTLIYWKNNREGLDPQNIECPKLYQFAQTPRVLRKGMPYEFLVLNEDGLDEAFRSRFLFFRKVGWARSVRMNDNTTVPLATFYFKRVLMNEQGIDWPTVTKRILGIEP